MIIHVDRFWLVFGIDLWLVTYSDSHTHIHIQVTYTIYSLQSTGYWVHCIAWIVHKLHKSKCHRVAVFHLFLDALQVLPSSRQLFLKNTEKHEKYYVLMRCEPHLRSPKRPFTLQFFFHEVLPSFYLAAVMSTTADGTNHEVGYLQLQ